MPREPFITGAQRRLRAVVCVRKIPLGRALNLASAAASAARPDERLRFDQKARGDDFGPAACESTTLHAESFRDGLGG